MPSTLWELVAFLPHSRCSNGHSISSSYRPGVMLLPLRSTAVPSQRAALDTSTCSGKCPDGDSHIPLLSISVPLECWEVQWKLAGRCGPASDPQIWKGSLMISPPRTSFFPFRLPERWDFLNLEAAISYQRTLSSSRLLLQGLGCCAYLLLKSIHRAAWNCIFFFFT